MSSPTVRSTSDETVRRAARAPTSSLEGASNILIQDVCPGRTTSHIGSAVDSVTFAAIADAVAHKGKQAAGSARTPHVSRRTCDNPYARGSTTKTTGFLTGSGTLVETQIDQSPHVTAEPKVRKVFKQPAPMGRSRFQPSQRFKYGGYGSIGLLWPQPEGHISRFIMQPTFRAFPVRPTLPTDCPVLTRSPSWSGVGWRRWA